MKDQHNALNTYFWNVGNDIADIRLLVEGALALYGYKKDPEDKDHWLIDEEAAAVVRRIFLLAVNGHGPYEIATILTRDKVESPGYYLAQRNRGTKLHHIDPDRKYDWYGNAVMEMLGRQEYMGHTVNFRSYKPSYKSKNTKRNDPEKWVIFENTHEAIIDPETWHQAQRVKGTKKRIDTTGLAITEISRSWRRLATEEMEKYGLKGTHATYLTNSYRYEDGVTVSQLCELSGKDKSDASRMIAILEEKGFVQKKIVGGSLYRGKLVLTEKGRMAAEHISMRASKAVEMAGSELTDETRAIFYQALNSIVKNLKKLDRDGIPE